MSEHETLTSVAEFAIALAGFSGIVVGLRANGKHPLTHQDRFGLIHIIVSSLCALLFSLLPFVPHHLGARTSATWELSSLVFSAGLFGVSLVAYFGTKDYLNRLSRAWFFTYLTGSIASALGLLCNGLGVFGAAYPGVYLVGLGWLLFFSTTLFVRLVLAPSLSRES